MSPWMWNTTYFRSHSPATALKVSCSTLICIHRLPNLSTSSDLAYQSCPTFFERSPSGSWKQQIFPICRRERSKYARTWCDIYKLKRPIKTPPEPLSCTCRKTSYMFNCLTSSSAKDLTVVFPITPNRPMMNVFILLSSCSMTMAKSLRRSMFPMTHLSWPSVSTLISRDVHSSWSNLLHD